jgi:hypothetical protein
MLAQMAGAGSRAGSWLASFGRRPLVLSAPYPAAECLQRLAAVTSLRGRTTWYLDPRTALRPDPLFKGELYRSRTRLTRFADTNQRSPVWLEVRLDPQAGRGLRGRRSLESDIAKLLQQVNEVLGSTGAADQ